MQIMLSDWCEYRQLYVSLVSKLQLLQNLQNLRNQEARLAFPHTIGIILMELNDFDICSEFGKDSRLKRTMKMYTGREDSWIDILCDVMTWS